MEKSHKIALLSLASCFAVAATLCTFSAKLGSNIEASAEYSTDGEFYITLPFQRTQILQPIGHGELYGTYDYGIYLSPREESYGIAKMYGDSNALLARSFAVRGASFTGDYQLESILIDDANNPVSCDLEVTANASFDMSELASPVYGGTMYPLAYDLNIELTQDNELVYYYVLHFTDYNDYTHEETIEIWFTFYDIEYALNPALNFGAWNNFSTSISGTLGGIAFGEDEIVYRIMNYDKAYNDGYANGRKDGYIDGYANGIDNATDEDGLSWKKLFTSMIDVPINAIRELFDFEILGYNIASFLYSILTIAVVLTVVNLIL